MVGSQGTAPSPTVPVTVPAPIPLHQTKPAELQVISKEVLDKLLNQQDVSVQWFAGIAALLVLAITILVGWIHKRSEEKRGREFEQERKALREQFESWSKNADFERQQKQTEEELNRQFAILAKTTEERLATEVEDRVKVLFKDRYEEQIAQLTKALTQEALMITPNARGNLISILRRTVNELASVVARLPGEGATDELHRLLVGAIEVWHALGNSTAWTVSRSKRACWRYAHGLSPIALGWLHRLQQRYPSDLDLLPGIVAAIEAVEQVAQSEQA